MRFGSFFLATIAIGALVGWFAPGASSPSPASAENRAAPAEERLAVARSERWHADEVVLPRGDSGHFYAEVSTDSGKVMMLVDTGATVVALTGNDAAMMGIDWRESDVRPVARGASGDVYGVPVTLDRIDVGGIEARHVQAVVVPEGLDISLLGQSFLSKINRVEVTADEMVLHD
jgi:aspartyl protease family protein